MKKFVIIEFIIVLFVLLGCSNRHITDDVSINTTSNHRSYIDFFTKYSINDIDYDLINTVPNTSNVYSMFKIPYSESSVYFTSILSK